MKKQPPLRIDIFYAMITLGSTTIWAVLGGWLLYFYLPPEGEGDALVPAALYGGTMLITRVLSAVMAPLVGHLSDNTSSRWGRRLPFMFVAALPMLLFFVLIWTPPLAHESVWNLVYLGGVLALYNVAYTFHQVPYTALLPGLAQTDQHRVRISAWTSGIFLLGMILGSLAGPLVEWWGYGGMAVAYALAMLPAFYLPFLVLREQGGKQADNTARLNLRQSIAAMLKNKPFLIMTATGLFYWGITTLIQSMIPYVATEICLLSPADTYSFYVPAIVASLICYLPVTWLAGRFGKWAVFAGSLLASAVVLPGIMLIGDWWPVSLHAQGIAWAVLQAVAFSGVSMLPMAFGAEITDYDQHLTGQRREGLYYAAWGVLDQVVNGAVAALLPLILMLGRSRSDPNGPLGVRLTGVFGGVCMLLAFLVFMRYPLRDGFSIKEMNGEPQD